MARGKNKHFGLAINEPAAVCSKQIRLVMNSLRRGAQENYGPGSTNQPSQNHSSAWQRMRVQKQSLLVLVFGVFMAGCDLTDRGTKPEVACFNNLRNIDAAEQMWAMEN